MHRDSRILGKGHVQAVEAPYLLKQDDALACQLSKMEARHCFTSSPSSLLPSPIPCLRHSLHPSPTPCLRHSLLPSILPSCNSNKLENHFWPPAKETWARGCQLVKFPPPPPKPQMSGFPLIPVAILTGRVITCK